MALKDRVFCWIAALLLSSFPLGAEENSGQAVIQIGLSSLPSQLNPFSSTDANSQNLGRLTHISLVDASPEMEMVCRLCVRYSQWMDGQKHHLLFKLRRDVRFWDGSFVKAEDVKNSVHYFSSTDPRYGSLFSSAFAAIKEVHVRGEDEVEFVYDGFNLENLSNLPILKIVKMAREEILGAGPYKYGAESELAIKLLPAWDLDRPVLIFKIVKDETTLVLKLINKEIDLSLGEISPRKIFWMKKHKGDQIQTWSTLGTNLNYIGINHKRKILGDVRVREALSLLVPREDILKYKLKNTATLATSLLSPAFRGSSVDFPPFSHNPLRAGELLDLAGYPRDKNGHRFSLNWRLSNNKSVVEMAQTIAHFFENQGIRINLIIQEWGTFYRGFKNGEYDLVSASWVGLAGPEMLRSVFHSTNVPPQGLNRGFYQNNALDKILDLATKETLETARNDLYRKAQMAIAKDFPYLYLWHPNIVWVGQKCLHLGHLYPNGSFYPLLEVQKRCKR